jgi:hypothetical protein
MKIEWMGLSFRWKEIISRGKQVYESPRSKKLEIAVAAAALRYSAGWRSPTGRSTIAMISPGLFLVHYSIV